MNRSRRLLSFGGTVLALFVLWVGWSSCDAQSQARVVKIAELEIDPAQLEVYKAALKEEIEASVRIEPGVLTLYAVALKESPAQIRLFEIYADTAAYKAHLESPHFKRYKTATQGMVKALRLIETDPILLAAKGK